ncbi:hypothetical protein [Vibrio owensii]|uniref:hypothetical protein n=1 Tax=Vibrio owensii TaxID=696485 RepID=UPI0018F145FE|nr:hypothetical protein [Vibrio owensii]
MSDPQNVFIHIIWAHALYKFISIIAGIFLCYLGYKLHTAGISAEEGEGEVETPMGMKVAVKRFAPGTYLAILGTVVLYNVFDKGMETNYGNQQSTQSSEQNQVAPPELPSEPPF